MDIKVLPKYAQNHLNYMKRMKNKSNNSIKEYCGRHKVFFEFIKSKKKWDCNLKDISEKQIKSITLKDLQSYILHCEKEGNSTNTRIQKVAIIKSLWNYLHTKEKILTENIALDLEAPDKEKRLPKYLTLEQSEKLLDSIESENVERDTAIITLFLNCGLRLSELVSINISRIKGSNLTVTGKGNKERTIYLNPACIKTINSYLETRNNSKNDALFLSELDQRISTKTVHSLVKKHLESAGLDGLGFSCHKLRHTAATLMHKYGKTDILKLQKILGHTNLSTTQIYTHIDDEELQEAVNSNPLASR